MSWVEIMRQAGDAGAAGQLSRAFGVTPQQTEAVIAAVLPELQRGVERSTLSRGGVADLMSLMGRADQQYQALAAGQVDPNSLHADGVAMLEQLLGSKDRSRAVAAKASAASGISEAIIRQMLPYIATMAMGALAKAASGSLGSVLGRLPGLGGVQPNRPVAGRGLELPRPGSGGSSGPFGGGTGGGGPLPMPGAPPSQVGGSPYGDIGEVLRRQGGSAGRQSTGMLRNILGSLLGFSTAGGVMGWIFRAIVLRYGWSIVRTVLGRLLLRR